jgi:hypothetical protein
VIGYVEILALHEGVVVPSFLLRVEVRRLVLVGLVIHRSVRMAIGELRLLVNSLLSVECTATCGFSGVDESNVSHKISCLLLKY